MKKKITAIILTRNEETMIEGCIQTLGWCDEILVLDDSSTDDTVRKAEHLGARVVQFSHPSFARKRNEALKHAKNGWVLYIDADERVTPMLAKEILVHMETSTAQVFRFRRENFAYGTHFQHGGWQDDWVTRTFQKKALKEWVGDIHESPVLTGAIVDLHSPLVHLTHRSTEDNLRKSADWTKVEAELLYKSEVPPVTLFTLLRKGSMEIFRRAIRKRGRNDGMAGWIEAIVQGINRVLVYIQVWELQQKPPLPDRYQRKEQEIAELWRAEKTPR